MPTGEYQNRELIQLVQRFLELETGYCQYDWTSMRNLWAGFRRWLAKQAPVWQEEAKEMRPTIFGKAVRKAIVRIPKLHRCTPRRKLEAGTERKGWQGLHLVLTNPAKHDTMD